MPVVSEDTNELLRLTEDDAKLYEACLQAAIDALRSSWRYSFGMWRRDRVGDLVTTKLIGDVRGLIEQAAGDEIQERLAALSVDWRDVARELIADVVTNPDATAKEIACSESTHVARYAGNSSPPSPMAEKQETSGGPEKSFRLGNVSASVFVNQAESGRDFRNVVFQRSYRTESGERKFSNSFNVADLPVLERLLKLAQEHVEAIEAVMDDAKEK